MKKNLPKRTEQVYKVYITFFTDRTTWENTLGSPIATEDFNGVTPFVLGAGSNAAGQIDISLANLFGAANEIGDISEFWLIDGTTGFLGVASAVGAENITVDLPLAVFGFGADFSTTHSGGGLTLEIDSILAEFSTVLPGGADGTGFLGVISTNAFSSVRLFDTSQNETFGMDNVSFSTVATIPEPGTLAILGLGLVGLGLARGRRAA